MKQQTLITFMYSHLNKLASILIASLFLCVQTHAITISHIKGESKFETEPKRVVVLGNASLDVLDRLGIKPVGAPHSLLPDYLKKYESSTTNTGSVSEPDFEAIFTLKPDVIIAENRMLRIYDDLKQIAPTVMFYVKSTDYWQDTKKNWRMLGTLFNKKTIVEDLIKETQLELNNVNKEVRSNKLTALMLMNNGNKLAMFNKGSRFSVIFDDFGFLESKSRNIKPSKGLHGSLISFEYIADAKPDTLFILDREQAIGYSTGKAKALINNPLVHATPASINNRIVLMDNNAWYISSGGITATQTMISDIQKIFN